uniref:Uncharacterized protein n=1 Tax=Rhodnius prolixus TaxID=13249 RepID=T1HKJ3_RHOPR
MAHEETLYKLLQEVPDCKRRVGRSKLRWSDSVMSGSYCELDGGCKREGTTGGVRSRRQFTDVFQLEVFILTLFKPFESTFISHISTYLDVIAYLYIFD